jgi:tagaturonate reductase
MDKKEKRLFVDSVIERFENPYNKHFLADIGMNAVYKYKSRLIPSLLDYIKQTKKLPQSILFSLAALIVYYRPDRNDGEFLIGRRGNDEYTIRDNKEALSALSKAWDHFENDGADVSCLTTSVLEDEEIWSINLNAIDGLNELVASNVSSILLYGMKESVRKLAKTATK